MLVVTVELSDVIFYSGSARQLIFPRIPSVQQDKKLAKQENEGGPTNFRMGVKNVTDDRGGFGGKFPMPHHFARQVIPTIKPLDYSSKFQEILAFADLHVLKGKQAINPGT